MISVFSGIATAMDRNSEHATTGDGAATRGFDRFEAPAGGTETLCPGSGRKDICFVRALCSQWGAREILSQVAVSSQRAGVVVNDGRPPPPSWQPSRWMVLWIGRQRQCWRILRTCTLPPRLRHSWRRCVTGGSARTGLEYSDGGVMLDLCRATGRICGVTFAQVCALFER